MTSTPRSAKDRKNTGGIDFVGRNHPQNHDPREIGEGGIEFGNRNDPQLCKNSLGGIVFTIEIIPKNSIQERLQLPSGR